MKQRYYYIYIITNTITCRSYVGRRFYEFEEPYWGSSKYLKEDIKTYGLWNFSKTIIGIYPFIDKNELNDKESKYINEFNTLEPNGYNRYDPNKIKGFSIAGCHFKLSEEAKLKISIAKKGIRRPKHSKETNEKISKGLTGLKHSDETKQKMSNARLGKHYNKKLII